MAIRFLRNMFGGRREIRGDVEADPLPSPFFFAEDIEALHAFFEAETADSAYPPAGADSLSGRCYVCGKTVEFAIEVPADGSAVNWRETLKCPGCQMINRWRACLHLFEENCEPSKNDRIYLTETLSPVYQELRRRYPRLVGSEYVEGSNPGETVQTRGQQVRHEDVTALSFSDDSLEAVLSFDVLEHVPDYRAALSEFMRVLVRGGRLILSVPFNFQAETLVRAQVDDQGEIHHLVEPCYHGDPLSPDGVLSFYDFGMDLLDELREAGFRETASICYRSSRWGYLQNNVAFIARKL